MKIFVAYHIAGQRIPTFGNDVLTTEIDRIYPATANDIADIEEWISNKSGQRVTLISWQVMK